MLNNIIHTHTHTHTHTQTGRERDKLYIYIGLEFSLRLEKNFDARPVGRVLIHSSYR